MRVTPSARRFASWAYRFFIGPFIEKKSSLDYGSMTRWICWLFSLACVFRIAWGGVDGWPFAFVCFCSLFALGISKAIDRTPPEELVKAVTGMFGTPGQVAGGFGAAWPMGSLSGMALNPPVGQGRPGDDDA